MPGDEDLRASAARLHIDLNRPNATGICPGCGRRYFAGVRDDDAGKRVLVHEGPHVRDDTLAPSGVVLSVSAACDVYDSFVTYSGAQVHPTLYLRWAREHGSNPERIR